MIDLLVAGGGPAGLSTALLAARAGLEVAVVEPRSGTVDKACGEGLMPGAVAALARLGVHPDGHQIRGIRYTDGTRDAVAAFPGGPGRGVRRTALHDALRHAVAEAGVPIHQGRVTTVGQDENSVTAAGFTARYLAAADGLHSPVRAALGLDRPASGPRRFGLRRHYAMAPWTDLVDVHWAAESEAYVTPVGPDLVGVAILGGRSAGFEEALKAFPRLLERLPARPVTSTRGAGPLRQRVRRRVAGRVLLVGDAAGYVDALTGEGIAVSLGCAAALVDAVAASRPADYERTWRQASRRYRWLTGTLLWTRRQPVLGRAIVPA
ncbi:MAG: NAD(P)/FAD-dependent oxidoreductase, partial [Nakamurella sp.]